MDNTIEAVETAQAPGAFDVLAFVEGTAYPTTEVVIMQDVKSAAEYIKLVAKQADASEEVDDKLAEKLAELSEKLTASALVFDLRGMPPGRVENILKAPASGEDTPEKERDREHELVARTIIGVRNSKGERDGRVWQGEDVAKLREFVKEGEFGKLLTGVGEVNFNAMVFEEATDAGFSG